MPIVVCKRGLLYNKESLIKRMIEKSMPYEFRHVKKLSNLVTLAEASFDPESSSIYCAISLEVLSDLKTF